jgi:hypothetical protein
MKSFLLFFITLLLCSVAHAQEKSWKVEVKGDKILIDGNHVLSIISAKGNERMAVLSLTGDTLIAVERIAFKNPELLNDPTNPRGIIAFFKYRFIPMDQVSGEIPSGDAYTKKIVVTDLSSHDLIWPGGLDTNKARDFSDKFGDKYSKQREALIRRYGLRVINNVN